MSSHIPKPSPLGAPVSSSIGLPTQIPGYTNINFMKGVLHFPGLHPEADIEAIHFRRRKPRGFSNGHYLVVNPQAFHHNKAFKRTYFTYIGIGLATYSLIVIQQMRFGKWRGQTYIPPFYNDKYLERIGLGAKQTE